MLIVIENITMKTQINTPCIKICTIKNGVCVGCLRTLDQIANWKKYTEEQRKEIMEKLNG